MTSAEACIAVQGRPITGKISEVLAKRKYSKRVAKYLDMTPATFEMIDWVSHSRAMGLEKSPGLRRIIWKHHPTRAKLKIQGRCPTNSCLLCGKADTTNHFYGCVKINESTRYTKLRDEMRHKARAQGAPDHMINAMTRVMKGKRSSERTSQGMRKGCTTHNRK